MATNLTELEQWEREHGFVTNEALPITKHNERVPQRVQRGYKKRRRALYGDRPSCRYCGSTYVWKDGKGKVGNKSIQQTWRCQSCGKSFHSASDESTKDLNSLVEQKFREFQSEYMEAIKNGHDSEDVFTEMDVDFYFDLPNMLSSWLQLLGNQSYYEQGIICALNEMKSLLDNIRSIDPRPE